MQHKGAQCPVALSPIAPLFFFFSLDRIIRLRKEAETHSRTTQHLISDKVNQLHNVVGDYTSSSVKCRTSLVCETECFFLVTLFCFLLAKFLALEEKNSSSWPDWDCFLP